MFNVVKKDKTLHEVMVVTNGTVTFHPVYSVDQGKIETDSTMLPEEDATVYYNARTGGLLFAYHLDVPAKVEAEKLKSLRRSVALGRLFEYDREKGFDWFRVLPYIALFLALIFR
jgi:hypothetical protein